MSPSSTPALQNRIPPQAASFHWIPRLDFRSFPDSLLLVTESASSSSPPSAIATDRPTPRHTALVRVTHWLTTLCYLALLISGVELIISHPRFYWGEAGNVLTPSLFDLPIPSSRPIVKTGYGYVLPDQNGWSRYLHFQSAWLLVFTGLGYVIHSLLSGHFRDNLVPARADLSWATLRREITDHLRLRPSAGAGASSYNVLQRLSYLMVIYVLFPLMIWTGLAMSPGFTSAVPMAVTAFGGQQSARTIHFFLTLLISLFVFVHIVMISVAGIKVRLRAMITGGAVAPKMEP